MIYSISHHFHRGTQLWLLLDWSFRLKWCSQITNSGSVVGATRLGNSVAKKFQIQIIGRFNLQLDGEVLHSRHDSCTDWYNVVSGSEIYHNNFFDQGFVTAETCSLHGADVGSEPGHEQELGSLAHFIATLNRDVSFHIPHKWTGHDREEKSRNEWNGSFFFRCYSYRNANKSERTFVVRKEGAEIVEIDAHRFATDLIGVEMKNGPAQKGTNRQRIGGSNDTVDILTQI